MTFKCMEVESRVSELVEGGLAAAEQQAAEAHLADCARCRLLVEEVRQGLALCREVGEEELPLGLVTRILAQTSGRAPAPGWLDRLRAWLRPAVEPRFALSFAMALFSVSLVINAAGISLRDVRLGDLSPMNLGRRLDRSAHLTYARTVKFVNDLRVVYEIQSRLQISRPQREEESTPEQPKKTEDPKSQSPRNSADEQRGERYLALLQLGRSLEL